MKRLRDSGRPGGLGLRGLVVPSLLVLVPVFLIVRQPDLGTALLLLMSAVPMILLAGIRWRLLLGLAGAADNCYSLRFCAVGSRWYL